MALADGHGKGIRNMAELEAILHAELDQWRRKQNDHPYDDYYLYYRPTTAEHDGGILITRHTPTNPDYRLAMPQRIDKTATVQHNQNWIRMMVLGSLPVLAR